MIIAAAQAAGLHEKVMALPGTYWTIIGTERDAAGIHELRVKHAGCSGVYAEGPHVHVPGEQEGKLLAMARKHYLALRAAHRNQHVQPQWLRKHAPRELGVVPDFREAHRALAEQNVCGRRHAVAAGMTVPVRFDFHGGKNGAKAGCHGKPRKQKDRPDQAESVRISNVPPFNLVV